MRRLRRATLLLLAILPAAPTPAPAATGEGARYLELHAKRDELRRLNALLEEEARLASTRAPYVVLDLGKRTMDFRIRGKTFKTYRFEAIRIDTRHEGLTWSEVARRLAEPITMELKEGGNPELIPPDPDEDPNLPPEDGDGDEEPASDASLLGVDAPTDYQVDFEQGVVFHVSAPHAAGLMDKAMNGLGELAAGLRSVFSGWLGAEPAQDGPWLDLHLAATVETARQLHHSLLPGERFLIILPAPGGTSGVEGIE